VFTCVIDLDDVLFTQLFRRPLTAVAFIVGMIMSVYNFILPVYAATRPDLQQELLVVECEIDSYTTVIYAPCVSVA